jgi:hypothetical protein
MLPEILAKSGEAAKSGPIGLAVILILCILCYFLFKSMSKHLRTVRENYPADTDVAAHDRVEPDAGAQRVETVVLDKPPAAESQPTDDPPPAQP